jgi:alcohol dehydrogenase class IV
MSRPLGSLFHVPHGLSNASLLPTVIAFSAEAAPEKYALIAKTMLFASSSDSTCQALDKLQKGIFDLTRQLEIPRLRDCVKKSQSEFEALLPTMAADALASGSPQNNPIVPNEKQIIQLYRQAW